MKRLLLSVAAAVLAIVGLNGVAMMSPAYAVLCADGTSVGDISECYTGGEGGGVDNDTATRKLMPTINTIINVIIGIVGFVAVVMMIMGGISFVTSQGDAGKVAKARNTILYGVVGLIVALLAFAIVNFVLSNVFKTA